MSNYQMLPERLLDLYQYLVMYQRTYVDGEADHLIEIVKQRYSDATKGKDILKASNPRRAGRRPQYDDNKAQEVKALYEACGSVRQTAKEAGVSTTFVYKVIKG